MRRAFQRCAASLPRTLSSTSSHSPALFCLQRSNVTTRPLALTPSSLRSLYISASLREQAAAKEDAAEDVEAKEDGGNDGIITKFKELETRKIIHPNVVKALTEGMRLETMTEVQSATLNEALKSTDIIAQAKTGTGKTLAFLIPILQNILTVDPGLAVKKYGRRGPRATADDIRALVISPTRELAEQIAEEARKVCANTGIIVQCAVGGTMKRQGMRDIQQQGCHLLVGTPGRLKDILSDPYSRVEAPDLSALVFDEADRLLDQGFWPEIQEIMQLLPTAAEKDRQTLMFSATLPREVVTLARSTLKPGFKFVQTVKTDEQPTHERVPQNHVQYESFENALPTVIELCEREVAAVREDPTKPPFKAIVYFNSTAEVSLAHAVLSGLDTGNIRQGPFDNAAILQIHARLTQAQRTRAAERFRRCKSGILLSSDVTARGMDFPGVTHVIQVGLPVNREMYIHRIGRTARAGREGTGWLLTSKLEAREVNYRLGRLPLKPNSSLQIAPLDLGQAANIPADAGKILSMYQKSVQQVPREEKVKAWMSVFGTFQWFQNKQALFTDLVRLATYGWGFSEPPAISGGMVAKLGLRNVRGVRIGSEDIPQDSRSDGSRPERFGNSGGPSGGFGRVDSRYGSGPSYDRRGGGRDRDGRSGGRSFGGDRRSSGGFGGRDRGGSGGGDRGGFGGRGRTGFGGERRDYGGGDRNSRGDYSRALD